MEDYTHRVIGFYATRAAADAVFGELVRSGMAPDNVTILEPGFCGGGQEPRGDSDDVLREMLREGAIGTAVGTLAGAAGSVALATVNISLFIASPVVGTLVMLGWGASLGGLIGAVAGANRDKGDVADLVKDALATGHVVLVAHAATEAQTTSARQIVGGSMDERGMSAQTTLRVPAPIDSAASTRSSTC